MNEKWATEKGTEKLFSWSSIHLDKRKTFDTLHVAGLGCGTYLGAADDETDRLYEEVLTAAALQGINFFDTAINYREMRSERLLGRVLQNLLSQGIFRDQIVVSTKGGYIPSDGPPEEYEDFVRKEYFDTGILEPKDVVADCHSMSLSFLENQIHASLKNLKVDCIDLYSLHNPEIELLEWGEEVFYQKLQDVFTLFEKKVREKKIQRYGLATWNGFRQKKHALQIEKVLEAAENAGGKEHHFKAIQLPMNLVMLESFKIKNQIMDKKEMTFFEMAREKKLSLLISAPLMQSQVSHLPSHVFQSLPEEKTPILQALQFVLSMPDVTTAFLGMKQMEHFEENKEALFLPNWSEEMQQNFKKWLEFSEV